jgi:hypothetical protein
MFASDEIIYYTDDEAKAKKEAFAKALMINPHHPDRAAMSIESRASHVSYILTHWQYDPEVYAHMEALLKVEGQKAKIPTKEEFAASLISEANECRDKETKLDYFKLFANVMGYVEKPGAVTNINNTVNNVKSNVLVLPERKPAAEIEGRVMEQQRLLTSK